MLSCYNFNTEWLSTQSSAQHELFPFTSNLIVSANQFDNTTIQFLNEDVGWDIGSCLAKELKNVESGCLSSLAKILYQIGKVLFIPGLIIAGYIGALSLICTYLTCCTLCGV